MEGTKVQWKQNSGQQGGRWLKRLTEVSYDTSAYFSSSVRRLLRASLYIIQVMTDLGIMATTHIDFE